MTRKILFTQQLYEALKRVEEVLDADLTKPPVSLKEARRVKAWYEAQFGDVVRAAVTRAERGGL